MKGKKRAGSMEGFILKQKREWEGRHRIDGGKDSISYERAGGTIFAYYGRLTGDSVARNRMENFYMFPYFFNCASKKSMTSFMISGCIQYGLSWAASFKHLESSSASLDTRK